MLGVDMGELDGGRCPALRGDDGSNAICELALDIGWCCTPGRVGRRSWAQLDGRLCGPAPGACGRCSPPGVTLPLDSGVDVPDATRPVSARLVSDRYDERRLGAESLRDGGWSGGVRVCCFVRRCSPIWVWIWNARGRRTNGQQRGWRAW